MFLKSILHRRTKLFREAGFLRVISALFPVLFCIILAAGCATTRDAAKESAPDIGEIERVWGIRPVSLRLTAADHFLDFRYRVVDSEKASRIMSKGQTVYLIHQPSETVMPVPVTKLGPLRGTAVKPKADKQYAVLFNNINKKANPGEMVTMVIGEMRIENMKIDSIDKK